MSSQGRRIPDALLERYLAEAVDAGAKARFTAVLAQSPLDQARLEELRADSATFLQRHPPGKLVARFQEERRKARWWRKPTRLIPALAAAAVFLALLRLVLLAGDTRSPVVLGLHTPERDGGWSRVSPGQTLYSRPLLLEVKAPASGFVAVLSQDSARTVTVHYPYMATAAAPYDVSQPLLPQEARPSPIPGRVDMYALYSPAPFELGWAVSALKEGRALTAQGLPPGVLVGSTFYTARGLRSFGPGNPYAD
jgi:hypothetical protein